MACRCDKVQQDVYAIIPETRVTLDTRFLSQDVIVLPLQVADNLRKASLVVYLVAESGSIDNGQGDTGALLVKLKLWWLISNAVTDLTHQIYNIPTVTGLILTASST
jgi:hypothetical protein